MPGRDAKDDPTLTDEERALAAKIAGVEPWYVSVYELPNGDVQVESNMGDDNQVIAVLERAKLRAILNGCIPPEGMEEIDG